MRSRIFSSACDSQDKTPSCARRRNTHEEAVVMNLSPHLGYEEEAHAGGKVLKFAGEADFIAVPAVRTLLKGLLGQKVPLLIVHPLLGGDAALPARWASGFATRHLRDE